MTVLLLQLPDAVSMESITQSPVASAQVKSAVLLAGLYAEGETRVTESYISRNHSELMLSAFGADIRTEIQRLF